MTEIIIPMGCQSASFTLRVPWHDHNNASHEDRIEVRVMEQDKPRTVIISINGKPVFEHKAAYRSPETVSYIGVTNGG